MAGQGSPQRACPSRWTTEHGRRFLRRSQVLLWCCALWFATNAWGAAPLDLHLRVSWGNGERRLWQGSISVSEGAIHNPKCLGIEADAPDRMELQGSTLRFAQRTPMSLDGFDFHVSAPDTAVVSVELTPTDQSTATKRVEVRLADFVPGTSLVHDSELDDRRNRLLMQRLPADWLRVQFAKDSLVFSPSEELIFEVLPNGLGLDEGTQLRCTMQLVSSADDQTLWSKQHELRVTADGSTDTVRSSLVMPEEEGVYDLSINLFQRRFGDAIVQGKPLFQRNVQLIVIGDQGSELSETAGEWQLVDEIDSANPKWWDRYLLIGRKLPVIAPKGPLGDRPLRASQHGRERIYEIGGGGWHAAPIPVGQIGEPHLLEIEYPRGLRQTMGISVLEPDAAGAIGTKGLDSGIDVSGSGPDSSAVMERHRVVFWPRTKNPWLLLTNRRTDGPAMFGKMRVYAGPLELPAARSAGRLEGRRLVAAYLDKPLFAESFGAPESLDATTNRSLRDWHTFYWGAVRLAEYLRYGGYNAAFIPVITDGTTLYPTEFLDVVPKWDNGAFFSNGQDPLPKDVLEVLLRIFDREGLTLIPVVQFGTPLRELETIARAEPSAMSGIALVGAYGQNPNPALGATDARRGLAPYYNPLDPRVQKAMRRVTDELLQRCSAHPSFGGLALQLNPHGYAQLPDETWPLDDATFGRFVRELKIQLPPADANSFAARLGLVRADMRMQWLKWRAAKLAEFYQQLHGDIQRASRDAMLYLDLHELTAGRPVQSGMRPQLPARDDIDFAMLRHGLDVDLWKNKPGVVVLRPNRIAPLISLPSQATNIELAESSNVEDYFRSFGGSGSLNYHELQTLRVPGFDQVSPFGATNTYTYLASQISPVGSLARKSIVQSLVSLDSRIVADGGWMLPMGQEDVVRPLRSVLSQLPAERFRTVASGSADASDTVVRVLDKEEDTYIYVANASGLRASINLRLANVSPDSRLQILADREPAPALQVAEGAVSARLEAYDMMCFVSRGKRIQVTDWELTFDEQDAAHVRALVQDFRARVDGLRNPRALGVLANPGFEEPAVKDKIPGWTVTGGPSVSVNLDGGSARSGRSSLRFRVNQSEVVGRLRSDPFPLPKSGRLSVLARLRTSDPARQPPLRMAIEGAQANGGSIYLWSQPLGMAMDARFRPTAAAARPLPAEWNNASTDFLFHVVDLPTGVGGEVSVGFDMLGAGEVWIDDVEVFDMYFHDIERNELVKNVGSIQLHLQEGRYATCKRFLEGYWPRYVLEFAPAPPMVPAVAANPAARISQLPDSKAVKPVQPSTPAKAPEKKAPWYKLPRSPIKIPFL